MATYLDSDKSLNHRIRIAYWKDFKYVCSTIKKLSAEIRQDYKRKNSEFITLIAVRPIKAIAHKMYLMFRYSYRDDALFVLLSEVIKKLNILIRAIRDVYQTKYLDELEKVSSILNSFLGDRQSIQLELFDPQIYHDPDGGKRQMPCFVRWYNAKLQEISRHFRDKSMKVGFANPYINCGEIPHTQLSIPFGRAKAEAAKKYYLAAYFDTVTEVEKVEDERDTEAQEEIANLGLRTLRQVARFLGLPQKVNGKDLSKAGFVAVLGELLQNDRSRVNEALAAVN